jgi:hypothetical protein
MFKVTQNKIADIRQPNPWKKIITYNATNKVNTRTPKTLKIGVGLNLF